MANINHGKGGRYVVDPKNGKTRPAGKDEDAPSGTIVKKPPAARKES